ncbi:hypothetical protein ACOSP7_031387 [Xanthoceras sorbifolium]
MHLGVLSWGQGLHVSGHHHIRQLKLSAFKLSLTLASAPWGRVVGSWRKLGSGSIPEVGQGLQTSRKSSLKKKKKTKIVVGHGGFKCGSKGGRYKFDMLITLTSPVSLAVCWLLGMT